MTDGWDVVVTSGGTGGHVLPALAFVEALVELGLDRRRIGFVGGRTGVENELVPPTGTSFVGLAVRGLPRSPGIRGQPDRARAFGAMGRSVAGARRLLARHDVRLVVGMGGYASLPCVLAAGRGRPVVLYESNAVPGLAVRVGARRAAVVACAFGRTAARFPNGMHAGFLVRSGIIPRGGTGAMTRTEACRAQGLEPERSVLVVMGGSQGAGRLNDATLGLCDLWQDREDVAILHLTGPNHHATVLEQSAGILGGSPLQYRAIAFQDDMSPVYACADVLLCRSGASTCAEIAASGVPAVLVPYPHATDDHQRANAEEFRAVGAATMILDEDVDAKVLSGTLGPLLSDRERLDRMSRAASGLGEANGAEVLASTVLSLLESGRPRSRSRATHRKGRG